MISSRLNQKRKKEETSTAGRAKGFTLVELMIVLMIVGVFGLIGVPGFVETVRDNRLVSQGNELLGAMYFARSEAIKLHADVLVCSSSDSLTCDNANWDEGWIVWHDDNGDGAVDNDPAEILRVSPGLDGGNTIRTFNSGETQVNIFSNQFSSRGLASTEMSWAICDTRGADDARSVIISLSGRAKVSDRLSQGGNIACP